MAMYGTSVSYEKSETHAASQYSPEVEAALLDLSKRSVAMSEEQWAIAKEVYGPYEKAMVDYNMRMLPETERLSRAQIEAQEKGVELYGLQVDEAKRDILEGREVKDALREQQLEELGLSAPVARKFYEEAVEGIEGDVGRRMGEATADVAQAYKGATGALRRELGRVGGRITAADIRKIALERAKDIALARTGAREREERRVEDVNWNRLATGMSVRGSATGLAGTGVQTGAQMSGTPTTSVGSYGLTSPTSIATSLTDQALSSLGMTKRSEEETTRTYGMEAGLSLG